MYAELRLVLYVKELRLVNMDPELTDSQFLQWAQYKSVLVTVSFFLNTVKEFLLMDQSHTGHWKKTSLFGEDQIDYL